MRVAPAATAVLKNPATIPMSVCLTTQPDPSAPVASTSARPRFTHARCAPSPSLAPFVEHYWVTRWDRRGVPGRAAASLLDPCVHLQVQDGRAQVMGVMRRPYRIRIEGMGAIVGVKFRPGGFHPFVQRPVAGLTDRILPAAEVFAAPDARDTWARELTHAVVACRGDGDAHAAIIATHLDAFLGEVALVHRHEEGGAGDDRDQARADARKLR